MDTESKIVTGRPSRHAALAAMLAGILLAGCGAAEPEAPAVNQLEGPIASSADELAAACTRVLGGWTNPMRAGKSGNGACSIARKGNGDLLLVNEDFQQATYACTYDAAKKAAVLTWKSNGPNGGWGCPNGPHSKGTNYDLAVNAINWTANCTPGSTPGIWIR
jgi:hypothetical protein